MIIGITGTNGAGKGTIVEHLKDWGFNHFSVREFITKELEKRGLEVNRTSLIDMGNQLRKENSPSYIVEQLYEQAERGGGNAVIESLRCVGEVEALKKKLGFSLFAIDADVNKRYERAVARKSSTDNVSFEEFKKKEKEEMSFDDINKQNIFRCMEMADYKIENNGTIEELRNEVERVFNKINNLNKAGIKRPSWDEYFTDIARTVAKRATCSRGMSGCVIVRDKQMLVSGYVGSPKGLPHCDEVGHQMKSIVHEDGTISQHCTRTTHAEQNAICQAAKLGISINNATLYCKMTPCSTCAKLIINSGIKRVVAEKRYHQGKEAEELFKLAGVQLDILDESIEKYENQ